MDEPKEIGRYWRHPDGESILLQQDDSIQLGVVLRLLEPDFTRPLNPFQKVVKTVQKIEPCETSEGTYIRIWMTP
jgi:hypothetical protein